MAAVFSGDGGNLPGRDGRIHHNTARRPGNMIDWTTRRKHGPNEHPMTTGGKVLDMTTVDGTNRTSMDVE